MIGIFRKENCVVFNRCRPWKTCMDFYKVSSNHGKYLASYPWFMEFLKTLLMVKIVKIHESFFIFVMFCTRKNYWPCLDIFL